MYIILFQWNIMYELHFYIFTENLFIREIICVLVFNDE